MAGTISGAVRSVPPNHLSSAAPVPCTAVTQVEGGARIAKRAADEEVSIRETTGRCTALVPVCINILILLWCGGMKFSPCPAAVVFCDVIFFLSPGDEADTVELLTKTLYILSDTCILVSNNFFFLLLITGTVTL